MFTRHGGVSQAPYDSLNLGLGVQDVPERVEINRERVRAVLGLDVLVSARQVHSDRVHVVRGDEAAGEIEGVDALVTDRPGVGLLIQQADCQAVLLLDPEHRVIAAVHNGWRGSACNIIGRTIAVMRERFATEPACLLATVSPSLGPCCSQFVNYRQELPPELHAFRVLQDHFDFWAISRHQLQRYGVRQDNIEIAGICTRCSRDFFSYRRARARGGGITGRNGSVIRLPRRPARNRRAGGHGRTG